MSDSFENISPDEFEKRLFEYQEEINQLQKQVAALDAENTLLAKELKNTRTHDEYDLLFNTTAQGILIRNAQGKITYANPAASNILGKSSEELLGVTSFEPRINNILPDALRNSLQVDLSFQNTGGVRSSLNQGDITTREIYEISPFNNGTVIYEMSVLDIKKFLKESGAGFYYSGVELSQNGQDVIIKDVDGKHLEDEQILRVGLNDYIPAVHDTYFPETGTVQELTDAETIIEYLRNNNSPVDYPNAERYFRMK
jgi:PAS domain S-box-containing protein